MRIKEVRISDTERSVICHNPEAAERGAHIRTQLITQLIDGSDQLSDFKRGELRGKTAVKPGLNRHLRTTPAGKLRIDHATIKAEANLDGKYLLRCGDPHLSAADIVLGYKQLLDVERGWRDMKQILDLRPVYHRLENASALTSCSAGSPCCSSASSRPAPAPPRPPAAASSTASTWAPSPVPPAPSVKPPRCPSRGIRSSRSLL